MNDTTQRFVAPRDAAYFAREAALIGARQAFARPSSAAATRQQRQNASSLVQLPLYGVQPKPPPPLPPTRSSSVRLSPTTTAAIQRTNSIPSLRPPSDQEKSPSPSNRAAGAAVSRDQEARHKTSDPISNSTDAIRSGVSKLGNSSRPLNQPEPVQIIPQSSKLTRSKTTASIGRPRKPSKPVELESGSARPSLKIDTPQTPTGAIIQANTAAPEIHSPKPIRPASTAAAFEAASAKLQTKSNQSSTTSDSISAAKEQPEPAKNEELHKKSAQPIHMPPPSRPTPSTTKLQAYQRPPNARSVSQSSLLSLQDDSQRIDALANAIVGAHLASSRASSPAKSPAPPWGRLNDRLPQSSGPFRGHNPDSRTPSPAKRMRHTLRKTPQPELEEDQNPRRARGPFHFRQHPHKHHEGDRKRWRDEISHEERKRYEGVWAANRDVYMRFTQGELVSSVAMDKVNGQVSALVVKDIWARSRLPEHELEEIWDVVDRQKLGRLDREEFVIGLWLIDQRLKGRKIPSKVGSSVWQSVRGIYGLKVPKRKD